MNTQLDCEASLCRSVDVYFTNLLV